MIPEFDPWGNLPPGLHLASFDQIEKRFAFNAVRMALFRQSKRLARELKNANCPFLYIGGDFVSSTAEPETFEACWETRGVNNQIDAVLRDGLQQEISKKYGGRVYRLIPETSELGSDPLTKMQWSDELDQPRGVLAVNLLKEKWR